MGEGPASGCFADIEAAGGAGCLDVGDAVTATIPGGTAAGLGGGDSFSLAMTAPSPLARESGR